MICIGNISPGYGLTKSFEQTFNAIKSSCASAVAVPFGSHLSSPEDVIFVNGLNKQIANFLKVNRRYAAQSKVIAYILCESDQLDDSLLEVKDLIDEIWTASTFCQTVIQKDFICPVHVVPLAVNSIVTETNYPEIVSFLCVFDGGSRLLRKNPFTICKAFATAFKENKKVQLVFKLKNVSSSIKSYIKAAHPNIFIVDGHLNQAGIEQLYQLSTFLVSLHKGEGFGYTVLEGMANGLPGIVTDWSATKDFFDDSLGFPVAYEIVPTDDEYFCGNWAEPKLDSAVEAFLRASEITPKNWQELSKRCKEKAKEFSQECLNKKVKNLLCL